MSLTKEECENALMNLCSSNARVKDRHIFKDLIEEHFETVKENENLKKHLIMLLNSVV